MDRTARTIACAAAAALTLAPMSAAADTRAGDNPRIYSPSVATKSGLQRAPQGEDEGALAELPLWQVLGGVTLLALIALAVGGGGGSSRSGGGFQSNGAN